MQPILLNVMLSAISCHVEEVVSGHNYLKSTSCVHEDESSTNRKLDGYEEKSNVLQHLATPGSWKE